MHGILFVLLASVACAAGPKPLPPRVETTSGKIDEPIAAATAVERPTRGLLRIEGRRGHHAFCDDAREFDLATGALAGTESCSQLIALPGQSQADASRRRSHSYAGTVDVEKIREAARMMIVAEYQVAPNGVVAGDSGVIAGDSDETRLDWRLTDGASRCSGTLTWPRDQSDDARNLAVELLQAAEQTFRPASR